MTDMKAAIAQALRRQDFSAEAMAGLIGLIMDGAATPAQIAGLLVALAAKGETSEELAGAAMAMRARAVPLVSPHPERSIDTCGTGGDNSGTVNISTLAAIIVAACGGVVAKHGNRALSSQAGSADVLEALGVRIDASPAVVERCMGEAGIGFAFAPAFHAATKHAAGPRRELGVRTLFNLLGPLTNPARVEHQVVGVFAPQWCVPMALALGRLGLRRAVVVHGAGGLDEIAVRGHTQVACWEHHGAHGVHAGHNSGNTCNGSNASHISLDHGSLHEFTLQPYDFGMIEADPAQLAGGDAAFNAQRLRDVLAAQDVDPGQANHAVFSAAVMTAALALAVLDGDALTPVALTACALRAAAVVRDGRAERVLHRWAKVSHG